MSNQRWARANFQYCTLGVAELQIFEDPCVRPAIFGAMIDLQHLKLPLRLIIDPLILTYLVYCITFSGLAEPFSTKTCLPLSEIIERKPSTGHFCAPFALCQEFRLDLSFSLQSYV